MRRKRDGRHQSHASEIVNRAPLSPVPSPAAGPKLGHSGVGSSAKLRTMCASVAPALALCVAVSLSCTVTSSSSKPYSLGLAAQYPADKDLTKDPDVLYFGDFESASWYAEWGNTSKPENADLVEADTQRLFVPFQGRALRVRIVKESNVGLSSEYRFALHSAGEPEEIYFRYYLRFADDWRPIEGGKLPGPAGTYGVAGWGGRRSDGTNGWSARGSFSIPQNGVTPIGFYAYHADQPTEYGDVWEWERRRLGYLRNNRWYCVEQYVRLNGPSRRDGILRGWIDGQLAFEKTDVRFRTVDALKIETIWMNVYHGGSDVAVRDHHLYVDNVIIARRYIGPMNRGMPTVEPKSNLK